MGFTFKEFKLSDLTLWDSNPRLDETTNDDLVVSMLDNQREKLYRLAKDIAENGLIEPIAILKDNNINLVKEGNRRIVALMILQNPDILNDTETPKNKNLINNLKNLSNLITSQELFNKIKARVYERDYENELDAYIESRHMGENKGVGVVTWNTNQKARWDMVRGNSQPVTEFLMFLKNNNVLTINEINGVTKTNWERIFNSKSFSDYMCIKKENKTISSMPINANLKLKYKIISQKLRNKSVKIVYDKEAQKILLDEVDKIFNESLNINQNIQDNFLHDESLPSKILLPSPQDVQNYSNFDSFDFQNTESNGGSIDSNNTEDNNTPNNNDTKNQRDEPIENNYDSTIKINYRNPNPKRTFFANLNMYGVINNQENIGLINVVKEIKKISRQELYMDYPIATTFLMRSLIEQSLIYYMKKKHPNAKILRESNGSPKLDNLINYYNSNLQNIFGENNKMISRTFSSFFNNSGTKSYLDMVVHNPHLVTANGDILNNMSESGLFTVIDFILNE